MKKRIIIESEEKNRILNLHKKFLNEGIEDDFQLVGAPGTPAQVDPANTNNLPNNSPKIESSSGGYTDTYVKEAQTLLGVKPDGKFGPITLKALKDKIGSSTSYTGEKSTNTNDSTKTVNMDMVYRIADASGTKPKDNNSKSAEENNVNSSSEDAIVDVGDV